MVANLVFSRTRHAGGPVSLVFGGTGGEGPPPDPVTATFSIAFPSANWSGIALYDNRNPRRAGTSASVTHDVATRALPETAAPWGLSARQLGEHAAAWSTAIPAAKETAAAWAPSGRVLHQVSTPWGRGTPREADLQAPHQRATSVKAQAVAPWQVAGRAHATAALGHQVALLLLAQALAPHQVAQRQHVTLLALSGVGTGRWADLLALWEVAGHIQPGREVWPPVNPGAVTPRVPDTHLVFACPPWLGGGVHLVFGHVCAPDVPTASVVVPVRSVYMIVNTASLRRVSNNQSLPTYSTSLTIDADSWTWGFQATMPADALGMIQRISPAEPVEVELTVNGQPYRALIESAVRSRTFKDWQLTVRGRGLGAVLDTPYAPQRLFTNTAVRTAQQLIGDALTIGGEGFGWGVEWNIDDWLVPAGAWNHRGSMISAVNAIAAAAGAYVQPHPTSQTLRVLPRYPGAPWEWGAVTPDIHLPAAVMSVEGIEWVDRPDYNRVFVSGVQAGVNGQVTRAGTAGDMVAGMVTDPLITAVEAARQRGISELAKGGTWAEMSLKLPVLTETGVIHPGKFVRYNDGDVDRLGIVRSTNVQDDGTEIWQTIGVESYVA